MKYEKQEPKKKTEKLIYYSSQPTDNTPKPKKKKDLTILRGYTFETMSRMNLTYKIRLKI